MKKDTLDGVLAIKFEGNFKADAAKFKRINDYLSQKGIHPLKKFAADMHANYNGMGCNCNYPGDDYYNNYEMDEEIKL